MRLPIVIRRGEGLTVIQSVTSNISTDGFYFETNADGLQTGEEVDLDLTLPPADGVSAFEGRASAAGEITRVVRLGEAHFGVAGRFRKTLKLTY